MDDLLDRFETLGADAALYAPRLLGALAFLALGALVAWGLSRLIGTLCQRFDLDESGAGRRVGQVFALVGLPSTLSIVLRRVTVWIVMLIAAAQAVRFLELDAVADVIDRAAAIGPVLLVVLAVLLIGAGAAERLSRAAGAAAQRSGAIPPALATGATRVAVLSATIALALEATGVTADLPLIILGICLAAALLLAITAALIGARGLLENLLAARYVEEHYIEGQMISFHGEQAQIRAIGLLATVVRMSDGADHTTPNALFLRDAI